MAKKKFNCKGELLASYWLLFQHDFAFIYIAENGWIVSQGLLTQRTLIAQSWSAFFSIKRHSTFTIIFNITSCSKEDWQLLSFRQANRQQNCNPWGKAWVTLPPWKMKTKSLESLVQMERRMGKDIKLEDNRKVSVFFLITFYCNHYCLWHYLLHATSKTHWFWFHCCGIEITLEVCVNTLGIDACNFTLILWYCLALLHILSIHYISGVILGRHYFE